MASVDVLTREGKPDGSVELDDEIFAAPVNVPVMHQVVTAQLAAARSATSKTKTRGEVRGGGRKPWRQKGTGRARQGSIRSPQWSGGGIAHGPSGEQNYTKRVSKKLKKAALRSALSDRAAMGAVKVVGGLAFDAPRTKDAVALLDALELGRSKVLLVLADLDDRLWRSFRNLRSVHLLTVDQLNTYDVLCSDVVVFQREALELIGTGRRADRAQTESTEATEGTESEEVSS